MLFMIKHLAIITSTIYAFSKISTTKRKYHLYDFIFVVLTTFFCSIIDKYHPYSYLFIILLLSFIYFKTTTHHSAELVLITTIISYSMSYISFTIASLTIAFLGTLTYSYNIYNPVIFQLFTAILQLTITCLIFIPKRLRNGMPFLSNKLSSHSLTTISLIMLFIVVVIRYTNSNSLLAILIFIIFSFSLFIYIYWRNNITRTYNEKLRLRDIQDLNKLLDSKEDALKELEADKDRLSAIVHTDNKLVPAMIQAVESFLTDFPDATPEMVARGEEILHTLDGYMESRKDDLAKQDKNCFIKVANTGIPAVNLTLEHMYAKAQANNISLGVNVEADTDFLSNTTISEEELNTMISDLLENAIIATSYTNNKRILFTIGMLGNALSISVFDSGIPFAKEVLVDFGREKHTTHGDTGGSGIGLMTIYEIAHKHRATIAIEEYDTEQSHYTKRIAITFNKRGNYILNTLRDKEEIAYLRQRTDLIINLKSSKM